MSLEMKMTCEKCEADLKQESKLAQICSYECTFCEPCAKAMNFTCPNCKGELVRRPTRTKK